MLTLYELLSNTDRVNKRYIKMKTTSSFTNKEMIRAKRWRFNPVSVVEPGTLARYLDAFEAGYLGDAAALWQQLEQRDDLLRGVIAKRKKSVGRSGWTVLPKSGLSAEEQHAAREQVEALEFFYNNLECENAVDLAERGSFKLLARQMMDAVGKRFAVHEIVWQTRKWDGDTNRGFVTAKFRFVPLGFFENTTGQVRFLGSESAVEGTDLEPGGWMVTVGDGLMVASSVAWMFKNIALNDWLKCSERNGTPGVRGISASPRDSAEWNALATAVEELLEGRAVVHGVNDEIKVVDLLAGGHIPFPQLVERIDRMLAALWRGADLSTLSRDRGYGASLQEKETCALEEDDADMLTETLNRYVDEWVIKYVFGEEAKPLAHVKVLASARECTTGDLQVDEFLLRHGAPLSIEATMSRYGRALPKPGEKLLLAGIKAKRTGAAGLPLSAMGTMQNSAGADAGPSPRGQDLQASIPESS